jgi:polysaccharide pyruvyl transferase WcaK-like protein
VYTLAVNGLGWYNFINHGKRSRSISDKFLKNRKNFIFSNNVFNTMNFLKNKTDFMFGTRIHGTILGLCAGLPSMCIAFDSRTLELCEQMNIPHVNYMSEPIDFKNKNELIEIFKRKFDISKLDALEQTIKDNKGLYKI